MAVTIISVISQYGTGAEIHPKLQRAQTILLDEVRKTYSLSEAVVILKKYESHLNVLKADAAAGSDTALAAKLSDELERVKGYIDKPGLFFREAMKRDLHLPMGWQKINGSKEGAQEFIAAMGHGSDEVITARNDNLRIFGDVRYLEHYLSAIEKIEGLDLAQNMRTTTTDVKHPGWPFRAFRFVTYTGRFHYSGMHFNSCQIVTDSFGQIVAFQLKNDGTNRARSFPGNYGYYNFVSSRRKGVPDARVGRETDSTGDLIIIKTSLEQRGRILETCVLFVPKPIASICRSIVN